MQLAIVTHEQQQQHKQQQQQQQHGTTTTTTTTTHLFLVDLGSRADRHAIVVERQFALQRMRQKQLQRFTIHNNSRHNNNNNNNNNKQQQQQPTINNNNNNKPNVRAIFLSEIGDGGAYGGTIGDQCGAVDVLQRRQQHRTRQQRRSLVLVAKAWRDFAVLLVCKRIVIDAIHIFL
jgi:uncharacterized protein with von Willebrand factor type A (vWA) domain